MSNKNQLCFGDKYSLAKALKPQFIKAIDRVKKNIFNDAPFTK